MTAMSLPLWLVAWRHRYAALAMLPIALAWSAFWLWSAAEQTWFDPILGDELWRETGWPSAAQRLAAALLPILGVAAMAYHHHRTPAPPAAPAV